MTTSPLAVIPMPPQVSIDGNGATVTAGGSGDNQVKLDGSKGQISAGGAVLGNQENTAGDKNPATGNYLTGLDNTTWDGNNIQSAVLLQDR